MTTVSVQSVYHQDPGHGWLVVTHLQLELVGLKPTDFTDFSYKDGKGRYALEEDCDMPKFIAAAQDKEIGVELKRKVTNGDSPIRSWRSINEG